ncbi:MAG: hypothetical protein M1834_001542 [Cirrosporium novae-zelandiae]|nr:MAG: hypothetical protein M1834_004059 [Cirrosporium novae-zelandiae]KAI9735527.1 MAG: hypothetical protein M1834_001542 [Cirrosporium novae-zelandiae]
MQSESSSEFNTVIFPNQHHNNQTANSKHGINDNHLPLSCSPLPEGERGRLKGPSADPGIPSPPQNANDCDGEVAGPQYWMNNGMPSLTTPSHANHPSELEQESISPTSASGSPSFRVTRMRNGSTRDWPPIVHVPNEILTHVLSHLSPSSLSVVSLVSKRFHSLVTTPHAWRMAFARFFPGPDAISPAFLSDRGHHEKTGQDRENLRSEKRMFTRLTALASWRSEYILRTRLIRSLARGRPSQIDGLGSTSRSNTSSPIFTYSSNLFFPINHVHADYGSGLNKRLPRFIHGADETGTACLSDPNSEKVDNWGNGDPQTFFQFVDRSPGDTQYGLGSGDVIGAPNVMDVSQPYGMIYGEGFPGGMAYFRSTEEQRGRFLTNHTGEAALEVGLPRIPLTTETITSVYISKSSSLPKVSEGLIGLLSGSSLGIITAYSLGAHGLGDKRMTPGELTACWILSPGVPIVAIAVDDEYSFKRKAEHRVWACVLNALGEVFYLTDLPSRPRSNQRGKFNEQQIEELAWETGRSVYWNIVELSRRIARPDPFDGSIDGSYSPRSSSNAMGLSKDQIVAETREIETFLKHKPKRFHKFCRGWNMRRRLEVDFAGTDGKGAGENVLVIDCGLDEGEAAAIRRYTRCKTSNTNIRPIQVEGVDTPPTIPIDTPAPSLFGSLALQSQSSPASPASLSRSRTSSEHSENRALLDMPEEWRISEFGLGNLRSSQITTTSLDMSTYALLTTFEDPLLGMSSSSSASSPLESPLRHMPQLATISGIPGHRGRFFAAGTNTGSIILWDVRAPFPKTTGFINEVNPVRVIYTDSPEISSLALTSLYLVHGGNDGLVQAWEPLASDEQPIRTIHSRFSVRARRRLVQAQASAQGIGLNLFAAGAISLDPDPTVLRGIVSLGTHLRYWSFSSLTAEQYKGSKRRLRRSTRGSNSHGGDRFSHTGRGALEDYIETEKIELEQEKAAHRKEQQRLAGRFGIDLLGPNASEEDMLAYAVMLSKEAHASNEQQKREIEKTATSSPTLSTSDVPTLIPDTLSSAMVTLTEPTASSPTIAEDDPSQYDADLAEAIRLSLQNQLPPAPSPPPEYSYSHPSSTAHFSASTSNIPIRYAKSKNRRRSISLSGSPGQSATQDEPGPSSAWDEQDELEFALQLSRAEEESRKALEVEMGMEIEQAERDEFPALDSGKGKGKGKGRAWS